jgi:hypothetical protein
MAALAPLATLASAGVGLYAQQQSQAQARAQQRAQMDIQQQQEAARQQQIQMQQQADARARGEQLARTVAATRARLAAGGLSVDDGSAATVQEGLRADAAAGQRDSDDIFRARLASGRASLLNPDGSLTTVTSLLRALPSFGTAVRSLLD